MEPPAIADASARRSTHRFYARHGKRWLSVALVVATAPITAPVLASLFLLNWLQLRDRRQVIFRQERVGRNDVPFVVWKLRTLRPRDDGRPGAPTPLGHWLRRHHLDELPQLLHVLTGEMCLVGPRPEMVEIEEWARRRVPGFGSRLVIRPGLTGLAQVRQGSVTPSLEAYREKLEWNSAYLEDVSLFADLKILLWTGWRVIHPQDPFPSEPRPDAEPDRAAAPTE